MSVLITTVFTLTGVYAGKTIKLGKFPFVDGQLTVRATPEETGLYARTLARNWSAYPNGHAALESQEHSNGERDLSASSVGDQQPAVLGGVQPNGEGSAAGGEAPSIVGPPESPSGEATEYPDGNGQPASVNDPVAEPNTKLQKAIQKLDPSDDRHWTAGGLPAMSAVETFYGATDITRADVHAAAPGYTRAVASAK